MLLEISDFNARVWAIYLASGWRREDRKTSVLARQVFAAACVSLWMPGI